MLRRLVLLLLLANASYYVWSQGLLAEFGFAPTSQAEPQRLTQQIKPDTLRILTPEEARQFQSTPPAAPQSAASASASASMSVSASTSVSVSTSTPTECLQVGLFNEEQTRALKTRLVSVLPANSWQLESAVDPARWLVYMGKYSSADAVTKKKSELRGMGVSFEALSIASLEPGLSLGSFKTQAEADAELARVAQKGVKTAKVIQGWAERRGQRLKLPTVDAALRSQLDSIQPQLAGKALQTCT